MEMIVEGPVPISVKAWVRAPDGRGLFLRRSAHSKNHPGLWDLPGGKVDEGESIGSALLREVFEETGLVVQLAEVLTAKLHPRPVGPILYVLCRVEAATLDVTVSGEHSEVRWFSAPPPEDEVTPAIRELLTTWLYPR